MLTSTLTATVIDCSVVETAIRVVLCVCVRVRVPSMCGDTRLDAPFEQHIGANQSEGTKRGRRKESCDGGGGGGGVADGAGAGGAAKCMTCQCWR